MKNSEHSEEINKAIKDGNCAADRALREYVSPLLDHVQRLLEKEEGK